MDTRDPEVQEFQHAFLERYGTIPDASAYQGYSFIEFLGESLHRHGTGFLGQVYGIASDGYLIQPVYRNQDAEQKRPVSWYENQAIHILHFSDHAYRKVD